MSNEANDKQAKQAAPTTTPIATAPMDREAKLTLVDEIAEAMGIITAGEISAEDTRFLCAILLERAGCTSKAQRERVADLLMTGMNQSALRQRFFEREKQAKLSPAAKKYANL